MYTQAYNKIVRRIGLS